MSTVIYQTVEELILAEMPHLPMATHLDIKKAFEAGKRVSHASPELEELRKDKERLDWLDGDGRICKFTSGWNAWPLKSPNAVAEGRLVRQAIDAVRTAGIIVTP